MENSTEKSEESEEKKVDETASNQLSNLSLDGSNPAKDFFAFMLDLGKTAAIVFVIAFLLRYFAVQPYIVDGESMMPTYQNREYLLAEKISYLIGEPKRGDVIVFNYPKNPRINYIKRIIGLPNETVKITDSVVTIVNDQNPNGFVLTEDYLPPDFKTLTSDTNGTFEKKLGNDEYFVMGDNREHSSDSREWGVLPRNLIVGRSWVTLLPLDRTSVHKGITYPNSK
jgi:signal peptidase I